MYSSPLVTPNLMERATNQSRDNGFKLSIALSFRELETLARSFLSVLLAFLDARISCNQAGLFQGWTKVGVILHQSAGNTVPNSPGLSRRAAAIYVYQNVELVNRFCQVQRLANDHAQSLVGKINFKSFAID